MSDLLEYKGYCGTVGYTSDGDTLAGKVLGIMEKLSYTGDSVDALRRNFESAIDGYLDACAKRNEKPQKPYRGIFNVRVPPELHRSLADYSITRGQTLNATVAEAFRNFAKALNVTKSTETKLPGKREQLAAVGR